MAPLAGYSALYMLLEDHYDAAVRACVELEVLLGENATAGQARLADATTETVNYIAASSIDKAEEKQLEAIRESLVLAVDESRLELANVGRERAEKAQTRPSRSHARQSMLSKYSCGIRSYAT